MVTSPRSDRSTADADPSPLLGNLPGSIRHRSRIETPAVRRGWLDGGPGPSTRRGADEFIAVSWDELTELLADELRRIVDTHGNEAIYGGSYGWASAGRFHHAQSQVHRFLKLLGGYTFSRHSYSLGATGVIMPRVVGTHDGLFQRSTAWPVIAENTELLVWFRRRRREELRSQCRRYHRPPDARSPRTGLPRLEADGSCPSVRCATTPTATASGWRRYPAPTWRSWLALAYVLATEGLADREFLNTYCTGYPEFERYLLGLDDGVAKSPQWAADICGLSRSMTSPHWPDGWRCPPHHRDGELVAAAGPLRRAGTLDGADTRGDARSNRACRRRFRARVRFAERGGHGATVRCPAADLPARSSIPSRPSFQWLPSVTCC